MKDFLEMTTNVVTINLLSDITFALIIMLIGFAVGKLVGRAIMKLLSGVDFDRNFQKISSSKLSYSKNISLVISWLIYSAAVIIALDTLNILYWIALGATYFIIFLILGTILLGIIFAIPNLIARFKINNKEIATGKYVALNGIKGEIFKVGLLSTNIRGPKGELFVVPNKILIKKIKNK